MQSNHDTKPSIVDTPLTLILQWAYQQYGTNHFAIVINNVLVAAVLGSSCTFSFIATLFFNHVYKYTL